MYLKFCNCEYLGGKWCFAKVSSAFSIYFNGEKQSAKKRDMFCVKNQAI